jgi:8-oxo-dGTP diphosphatase
MRYQTTKLLPSRFQVAVSVNLIFRKGGKYLLLRRANTGWADGYYTLPAGHLNGNEALTWAAIREAKEEVGVDLAPDQLKLVHVMHRSDKEDDQERIDFYFLVKKWQGKPRVAEPEKSDQLGWFAVTGIPERTLENVKHVLQRYQLQNLSEVNW